MDIDLVEEFIVLTRQLSVKESAQQLGISPSTLSKHMHQLESTLNLKLFERTRTGVRLTPECASILPNMHQLAETWGDVRGKAASLQPHAAEALRICGHVNNEEAIHFLGDFLTHLRSTQGSHPFEIIPVSSGNTHSLVESGQADLAIDFIWRDANQKDGVLRAERIADLPLVAIFKPSNPLANHDCISIDDLRGNPVLILDGPEFDNAWNYIERACLSHGFRPELRFALGVEAINIIATAAGLQNEALLLARSYAEGNGLDHSPLCRMVPLSDADAVMPLGFMYHRDNDNPLLRQCIEFARRAS